VKRTWRNTARNPSTSCSAPKRSASREGFSSHRCVFALAPSAAMCDGASSRQARALLDRFFSDEPGSEWKSRESVYVHHTSFLCSSPHLGVHPRCVNLSWLGARARAWGVAVYLALFTHGSNMQRAPFRVCVQALYFLSPIHLWLGRAGCQLSQLGSCLLVRRVLPPWARRLECPPAQRRHTPRFAPRPRRHGR